VFESDDNVGSSHEADVDAGYDDEQSDDGPATGADDIVGDQGRTSHEADVEAAQDD
jgi:hypothetical protein